MEWGSRFFLRTSAEGGGFILLGFVQEQWLGLGGRGLTLRFHGALVHRTRDRELTGGAEVKKVIGCCVLVVLVLLLASPVPSEARGPHFVFGFSFPLWVGPGWWGAPYPYYYPSPPVVVQQPPVYEQPAPTPQAPAYWYYCQNPQGYYPYIQQCPNGWMQVVPPAGPPQQ